MKISTKNAQHYKWGSDCEGWHLLNSPQLSVIQEKMPPGTKEVKHYHEQSEQVFFILAGRATFTLDQETFILEPQESLHIPIRTPHQIQNNSKQDLHFLVISHPKAHGDRILLE
ncbi:MAG: cupin domain-containing protein [Saprospiraceae bacterium]|nr:cupin domain-containing protein [Saprospiraceae bacterium]